jgi:hypothetical protein
MVDKFLNLFTMLIEHKSLLEMKLALIEITHFYLE